VADIGEEPRLRAIGSSSRLELRLQLAIRWRTG